MCTVYIRSLTPYTPPLLFQNGNSKVKRGQGVELSAVENGTGR